MQKCTNSFLIFEHVPATHCNSKFLEQRTGCNFAIFDKVLLGNSLIITNNSVAVVRERTIPTERPLLVGEVSANFC
jgi:hypothetical protein